MGKKVGFNLTYSWGRIMKILFKLYFLFRRQHLLLNYATCVPFGSLSPCFQMYKISWWKIFWGHNVLWRRREEREASASNMGARNRDRPSVYHRTDLVWHGRCRTDVRT